MTEDEIAWAYRYVLGREPLPEETTRAMVQAITRLELRASLLRSDEFAIEQKIPGHTGKWVITEILGGQAKLWIDLADKFVSFGCLIDNYEPVETAAFRRLLRPGAQVVDVGANVGWFTFVAAQAIGPEGHVTALEPRSPTAEFLQRSVALNGLDDRITVLRSAASNTAGSASIIWHPHSYNPGSAHLGEPDGNAVAQVVEVRRLDDLLRGQQVDCVKMDIEGAEALALLGAEEVLGDQRPHILCEINPSALRNVSGVSVEELLKLVRSKGYVVLALADAGMLVPTDGSIDLCGREVANVVLAHRERLATLG
jgi:FkbM family methyltransferase